MSFIRARCLVASCLLVLAQFASAQAGSGKPAPDPYALLQAAKAAAGGKAWDGFRTQHSIVSLTTAGMTGKVERWVDMQTGRSLLKFAIGPLTGAQGFDGKLAWAQDGSDPARPEISSVAKELAVNAAYRDKLAFWFPERGGASIAFKEHLLAGAQGYDVVTVTPDGGRPFEFWINSDNGLIERLVEPEVTETRTEHFSEFRIVQGVKLPFRTRARRGTDSKQDEIVNVDVIEFNAPIDGIGFGLPGAPAADWTFPAGKTAVDVPVEIANGHLFVQAMIDGKGPFRLLLDAGGVNVIVPELAKVLGLAPEGKAPGAGDAKDQVELTRVRTLDIGGVTLTDQPFAVIPLRSYARRVEGAEFDGLVGYELFRRLPAKIDYGRSRVTLYEPSSFRYTGPGARVPLHFNGPLPQVDATLDGIPAVFDVDMGARTSLTLARPFWKEHKLDTRFGAKQEVIAGAGLGGPARALLGRAGALKLGDAEIKAPVTMLSTAMADRSAETNHGGAIGYGVLRRFSLVFDYPREELFLESNAAVGEPDTHDRAGLWIERGDKGFELIEVVAGGPGAQAGLRKGDVVVAVDGVPAAEVKLAALRERLRAAPGTRVQMKLADGRERSVTLKDLI